MPCSPGERKAAGIFATTVGLGLMVGPGRHRIDDGEQERETAGWAGRVWEEATTERASDVASRHSAEVGTPASVPFLWISIGPRAWCVRQVCVLVRGAWRLGIRRKVWSIIEVFPRL